MNRFKLLGAVSFLLPLAVAAADLRVSVSDGPAGPSTLYIALYDSAGAYAGAQSMASQTTPMRNGSAQIAFIGLTPGRYALRLFADENGNGRMDANLLGIPTERYGFSNDARGSNGPPDFEAAALPVNAVDVATTVRLH